MRYCNFFSLFIYMSIFFFSLPGDYLHASPNRYQRCCKMWPSLGICMWIYSSLEHQSCHVHMGWINLKSRKETLHAFSRVVYLHA